MKFMIQRQGVFHQRPREAARRDDCRERLIELMKEHINGLEKLMEDKGIKISIDWVLKELGLDE